MSSDIEPFQFNYLPTELVFGRESIRRHRETLDKQGYSQTVPLKGFDLLYDASRPTNQ